MKTKSLFFAALLVFSSAVAFAGKEEPRATGFAVVPVKNGDVFKVVYKGDFTGKVTLNIYNKAGVLLLSKKFPAVDGFILPLNFKGLASGDYTIELTDSGGKKIQKVSYKEKSSKNIHVSRLPRDRSKFLLSIPNTGPDVISVNIYDSRDNVLHSETTAISGDFARVYKLDSAVSSYTFEIKDGSGNTKTIKF